MKILKHSFPYLFQYNAKAILSLALTCFFFIEGKSQQNLPYIDISKVIFSDSIFNKVNFAFSKKEKDLETQYAGLQFQEGITDKKRISPENVDKNIVLQFKVFNTGDIKHGLFLYPGNFSTHIRLFKLENNNLKPVERMLAKNQDSISFHYFSLNSGDTATMVAEISFLNTYTNVLNPSLLNENYITAFINERHAHFNSLNIFTYILCGLLLMMFLYSLAIYFQGADHDFLFYAGYVLFSGLLLFTKSFYGIESSRINYFIESYFDLILQAVGFIFYMLFMVRFLNTKQHYPFINTLYRYSTLLIIATMAAYSIFHFISSNYLVEYKIENFTKFYLLGINLIFIIYSFNKLKNHLLRFIFWGNLCLFVFAMISFIFILTNALFESIPQLFNYSLFYYEFGLFLELGFFLLGLTYKNKMIIIKETREKEQLNIEYHKLEFNKELDIYKAQLAERHRISADIHDELGSGMTAIRLYSEIARKKLKENSPIEIDKISNSANNLLSNLNAIIWSMNSTNDSIDNFISYIRNYAVEYLDGTSIHCKVVIPEMLPHILITGDKRRNLFLCIKETLHNALKYSEANEISIQFNLNHKLTITIVDNGIGIDLEKLRQFGNGLKNIKYRMEHINGSFEIKNNNGTVTILETAFD